MTHRIKYRTPNGIIKDNILIDAESKTEAENEFKLDFHMEVVKFDYTPKY